MAYDVSKLVTLGQLKSLALKVASEDSVLKGTSGDASSAITIYGARALANEVLGTSGDLATANTVYGAKAAAAAAQATADAKVASISAGNDAIAVSTSSPASSTAPAISLVLSPKTGNALSIQTGSGEEGLFYQPAAAVVYSMAKRGTAASGYAATYDLTADGVATGDAINIPKDMVIESGSVVDITYDNGHLYDGAVDVTEIIKGTGTATAADAGKYIKLVVANATDDKIYIKATDLVDIYTAGNGIDITSNAISVVIDSNNANGLSVGANGVALATVVASTSGSGGSNGAMTAAQAEKLGGITAGATKVEASSTNGNIVIDGTETTVYTEPADVVHGAIATDAEVAEMMGEIWPTT